ncbi:MAG: hypothetical protein V4489_04455 [Chlamydiota bacterium]
MLKKLTKLVCFTSVALSATLSADGVNNDANEKMQSPEIYHGGFTLGLSVEASSRGAIPYLTFGYISKCFLFDVGFNYYNVNFDSEHSNFADLKGNLGLRSRIYQNLFFTFGATGSVLLGNHFFFDQTPYSVGAFTGLDLQITKHFLLSGKINPYVFDHLDEDFNVNAVFGSGSIALSYVF